MVEITLRMWVHAELGTLWALLVDSVENPQKYVASIEEFRVVERDEDVIVRELKVAETLHKERVSIDVASRVIRRDLVDHPDFDGRIIVKAVPSSVQNPMAPVDLQHFLELDPKFPEADKSMQEKEDMRMLRLVSLLMEEQRQLREKAEEQEKIS